MPNEKNRTLKVLVVVKLQYCDYIDNFDFCNVNKCNIESNLCLFIVCKYLKQKNLEYACNYKYLHIVF